MSIVSTVGGREGGGKGNLHLSGQLDNYRVQGPQYYHVLACCLMPWLSRSEPFSVDSKAQAKPSPAMPCPGDVSSAGNRCFPHAGVAGVPGFSIPSGNPGDCRPAQIPAAACRSSMMAGQNFRARA